jgi:hypothetical protein
LARGKVRGKEDEQRLSMRSMGGQKGRIRAAEGE